MALASNNAGTVVPGCGVGVVPTRCQDPHPTASSASVTSRITCSTSRADVSFARPMPSESLAGRTIAGYHLLERVGEGGTAEVYRAEHPERGPAAFKVLRERLRGDPTAVKRLVPAA